MTAKSYMHPAKAVDLIIENPGFDPKHFDSAKRTAKRVFSGTVSESMTDVDYYWDAYKYVKDIASRTLISGEVSED